ncbi:hypothetical protein HDV02_001764 [Globomyces sp. JEL0801]|nr:hypothetical protein HDV02_001764 [Globomyces sp. JEL0801]
MSEISPTLVSNSPLDDRNFTYKTVDTSSTENDRLPKVSPETMEFLHDLLLPFQTPGQLKTSGLFDLTRELYNFTTTKVKSVRFHHPEVTLVADDSLEHYRKQLKSNMKLLNLNSQHQIVSNATNERGFTPSPPLMLKSALNKGRPVPIQKIETIDDGLSSVDSLDEAWEGDVDLNSFSKMEDIDANSLARKVNNPVLNDLPTLDSIDQEWLDNSLNEISASLDTYPLEYNPVESQPNIEINIDNDEDEDNIPLILLKPKAVPLALCTKSEVSSTIFSENLNAFCKERAANESSSLQVISNDIKRWSFKKGRDVIEVSRELLTLSSSSSNVDTSFSTNILPPSLTRNASIISHDSVYDSVSDISSIPENISNSKHSTEAQLHQYSRKNDESPKLRHLPQPITSHIEQSRSVLPSLSSKQVKQSNGYIYGKISTIEELSESPSSFSVSEKSPKTSPCLPPLKFQPHPSSNISPPVSYVSPRKPPAVDSSVTNGIHVLKINPTNTQAKYNSAPLLPGEVSSRVTNNQKKYNSDGYLNSAADQSVNQHSLGRSIPRVPVNYEISQRGIAQETNRIRTQSNPTVSDVHKKQSHLEDFPRAMSSEFQTFQPPMKAGNFTSRSPVPKRSQSSIWTQAPQPKPKGMKKIKSLFLHCFKN